MAAYLRSNNMWYAETLPLWDGVWLTPRNTQPRTCYHVKLGCPRSNRMGMGSFNSKIHNAHVHYYVTHRWWVHNNHIFGIPDP